MSKQSVSGLTLLVVILMSTTAGAALVQVDFNSNNLNSTLKGQSAIGAGLTGVWNSGSSVADIFAGDLTAPAGTNFNLTQTVGNGPQRVRFDNVERQSSADLATSLTGTVWGTFLVNTNDGGTAGIGVNTVEAFSTLNGRPRLLADGTGLVFIDHETEGTTTIADEVLPASGDSLILFKMVFDGVTGFSIQAWANPDLSVILPTPDISAVSANLNALSFDRLGVGGSRAGTNLNSYVDFITISDGPNAFQDVTGLAFVTIPEPGSLALFSIAGLGLMCRVSRRVYV